MLSRRALVGKLAAATAAVWGASVARVGFASVDSRASAESAALPTGSGVPVEVQRVDAEAPAPPAPPWNLLAPLAAGSAVGDWRVAELSGIEDGSCVLTLQNQRGRAQRIHLCRNNGSPKGVAYSNRFDLLVMNGGYGDLPTEESLAVALTEVAAVLSANERRSGEVASALLPHEERVRLFSGPVGRRLR
ncbi:MAG TPA: hypothetical protein VEB21_21390 [Terriglobales bacterium]|nr:hypothetical protein [Terriglobales bacterium]